MEICKCCLVAFNMILVLLLSGQQRIPCIIGQKLIPYDTFLVSKTVQSKASRSTMNVQLSCLDGEFMSRLLKMEPVDLMGSEYVRSDCIVPKSKYLTVVLSGTESVKLTINCANNCLNFNGEKGGVRYQLNCNTSNYELLGTDDSLRCNFRDQKNVHCFEARNLKGYNTIVATSTNKQYLFVSAALVKDGYPKLISFELTMDLDNGQPTKQDDVNKYTYIVQVQFLPYLFSKRCEMKPQSGFELKTLYKLSCKGLSLYSQKGYFFYSLSYKGLKSYIKQNEKLGESLEVNFILPSTPNFQIDMKLYVYSVKNGNACMEILSTFRYTVKPPISYGTLSQKIDSVSLSKDIQKANSDLLTLAIKVNEHSEHFNRAYSLYTENEKEEGLKNFITLRLKLLKKVYSLQVDKAQTLPELSLLLDTITKIKREFNSTGKLVCSKIYSNFANQLKQEVAAKTKNAVIRDANDLVLGISHMLSSYEVEPRFEMTAEEKNKSIQMSIESANQFLSAIDTISTAIWLTNQTSPTVEIRSPVSILKVTKTITSASSICDNPVHSTLIVNSTATAVEFKCQLKNDTSEEIAVFLSMFLIYNNPYALAESQKLNYPVISVKAYKDNAKYLDLGTKYISMSGPKVPVDIKWKKLILRFDFRREGNFLYPHYSQNFSIPMIALNSSHSSNHYIFINVDEGSFQLDVVVHLTRKLSFEQLVSGDFPRLLESRISNINHVNYTVHIPIKSIKEKVYFVMVKPLKNYTITNQTTKYRMTKTNDNGNEIEPVEIPMHFGVVSKSCLNWNDKHNKWSEKHCRLVNTFEVLSQSVECSCKQSSIMSASFFVPPNLVHPIDDAYLFAEFFTNPIMLLVVLLAWVIYIGLLHLTRRLDCQDMESSSVTALSNDLAGYIYLVCVKTKWWPGSGTTARVYLVIMGAGVNSSVLYLHDSRKRCFQSGDANWFLLTTENSIGDIKQILIWHDNSGSSPDWELDYVTIQDLQTKELWLFILSDWMSPNRGLFLTYAFLEPLNKQKQKSYRMKIFRLEVWRCFRQTHQWFSYIFPPPNLFTRAQRLTCTFALLLALMLGNIMFFGVPTDDPSKQVTIGSISISVTSLVIGLQTSLVIIPLGLILTQLFIQVEPKSRKFLIIHKKKKKRSKRKIMGKDEEAEEREMAENLNEKPYSGNKTGSYSFCTYVYPSLNQNVYDILQNLISDERKSSLGSSDTKSKARLKEDTAADVHDGHRESMAELKKGIDNEQEAKPIDIEEAQNTDIQAPKPDTPEDSEKEDNQKDENAKDSNTKKFKFLHTSYGLLPWWFVYISWAIAIIFCLIATYFIMLYGFKYGYEMSYMWTVAFFTSLLQSIFLEQPFEILFQTIIIVIVRGAPQTDVFHISSINENEKDFLTSIHNICYYEGNHPFVIHLPVLEKKTGNGPKQGPEKNFATA